MITFILFTTVVYDGDARDVYLGMNISIKLLFHVGEKAV